MVDSLSQLLVHNYPDRVCLASSMSSSYVPESLVRTPAAEEARWIDRSFDTFSCTTAALIIAQASQQKPRFFHRMLTSKTQLSQGGDEQYTGFLKPLDYQFATLKLSQSRQKLQKQAPIAER